jgi:hypothetical protein
MQNVLNCGGVGLPVIMHVKADLLNDVGDVKAGEHQVLEGPGEAHVLSRISNMWLGLGGGLACVSMGVETGLQSIIPTRSRISREH